MSKTNQLRSLTDHELEVVAGGADLKPGKYYWDTNGNQQWDEGEKIIAIEPQFAPVGEGGGGGGEFYDGYSIYDASFSYFGAAEGGVGGPNTVAPEDCRDRTAIDAKDIIRAESDDAQKEHAVIAYRGSDGAVHKSPIFQGNACSVNPQVMRDWLTANGIPMSSVIALIHNHPAWCYGTSPEEEEINRYPSANDWNMARDWVADGAGGAGGAGFALYVIDTRGDLREFAYSDRASWTTLSNVQKINETDLPPELIDDGSNC